MFKVIVAGGRTFNDYKMLQSSLDGLFSRKLANGTDIQIVSGAAKGADSLGERYANDNVLSVKQFPADWSKHGRSAGPKRNTQMAEYADALVAFWDGESSGTAHMIRTAKGLGLIVRVVRI